HPNPAINGKKQHKTARMKISKKYESVNSGDRRYIIHQGGTGSGKTYSILQYLLSFAIKSKGSVIFIVSESIPHLKRGALRDARRIIEEEHLEHVFIEHKSDFKLKVKKSTVEFFSADNGSKLRGARRDLLFINECNNVSYEAFQQLDVRTRYKTFLDFNPVRSFWVQQELIPSLKESDYMLIKSTYRDNPHLQQGEIKNIERRQRDANWWRVYGEGETGEAQGLVFNNWDICKAFPPECMAAGCLLGYGIDFGYTNSPTAMVEVRQHNGCLYVKELLYQTHLQLDQIYNAALSAGIQLGAPAIADCSEPRTINYLMSRGWSGIKPCIKGPDSIAFGLNMLLQRKIYVTADSLNLIKELRQYTYHERTRIPVKEHDHAIDALRYLVSYPVQPQKPKPLYVNIINCPPSNFYPDQQSEELSRVSIPWRSIGF
ncbi:MAG: PBSX family phage terminase large subunit, partial [Bacteroidia bacterium]|nr:PBSX family phage terminase large subunit [Bacteroidia bacterium]